MLQSILAAVACCAEGISTIILALSVGLSTLPTVIGLAIAAAGMVVFHQVAPLSIMTDQLILLSHLSQDHRERQSIVLFSGLILTVLGLSGAFSFLQNFIGQTIMNAMMAGVGVLLVKVALDMVRKDLFPGIVSLAIAVLVYFLTDNLVYTVASCVAGTTLIYNIFCSQKIKDTPPVDMSREKIKLTKPVCSVKVIRSTLALSALMIGAVVCDASITTSFAGWEYQGDHIALYTGIANMASSVFGGAPLGTLISGTALSPLPMLSGIIMMGILAAILLFRIIPRIARYIPVQGVSGFIFVLAAFEIFPDNAAQSLTDQPLVAAVTIMVTAFVDPFAGMCAGVAMKYLLMLLGAA